MSSATGCKKQLKYSESLIYVNAYFWTIAIVRVALGDAPSSSSEYISLSGPSFSLSSSLKELTGLVASSRLSKEDPTLFTAAPAGVGESTGCLAT